MDGDLIGMSLVACIYCIIQCVCHAAAICILCLGTEVYPQVATCAQGSAQICLGVGTPWTSVGALRRLLTCEMCSAHLKANYRLEGGPLHARGARAKFGLLCEVWARFGLLGHLQRSAQPIDDCTLQT